MFSKKMSESRSGGGKLRMVCNICDIWVHSNVNLVQTFMNWGGLAQLLDVSGHVFQAPDRPKQDPSKTLKPVSSWAKILWDPKTKTPRTT